ncbi:hypothetical protein NCAS_0B07700 [Naumovozyma castellii]|uniref:NTR2 n=1 Tax=Naumovozyma castellii TaxID=27288 RepID=G0VAC4_NAUCA|nr:hypothetical protein NCAS_0B07700 [Naumovozyma castellii CBS 4309]CCC68854.1 hypothetical protein NCAS_0B07700 [Naumovozyma castellii CBS 4309]
MSFKKRNKLKVPTSAIGQNNLPITKNITPSLNLSFDDEENDEEEILPLTFQRKGKNASSIKLPKEIGVENNPTTYDNIYSSKNENKKSEVRILNMDDEELMELDDQNASDNESSEVPTQKEIDEIKKRREKLRLRNLKPKGNDQISERAYVKLLDKEDKIDLMDTITKNGGLKKANEKDNISDGELEEFEDDMLELTESQAQKQRNKKRELIEDAIASTAQHTGDYEKHILSSNLNIDLEIASEMPKLPTLFASDEDDTDENALATEMSKLQFERKKITLQVENLKKQQTLYLEQQQKLLKKLTEW